MGSHPVNLFVRFLLEIISLVSVGIWGWRQQEDWLKVVLAIGLPMALAAVWGIFAVADDPSRSGKTLVKTPGPVRLIIELAFFAGAIWCLWDLGWYGFSYALGVIVLLHYVVSYDRVKWLMSR